MPLSEIILAILKVLLYSILLFLPYLILFGIVFWAIARTTPCQILKETIQWIKSKFTKEGE